MTRVTIGVAARIRKVNATIVRRRRAELRAWHTRDRHARIRAFACPTGESDVCRLLADSSGCRVIAVDYRRAPEHPFPAPLEDCWDALQAVAAESGDSPLIIAGDSAGGNMSAVCALRAMNVEGRSWRCRFWSARSSTTT